jgi:hypothetical protein
VDVLGHTTLATTRLKFLFLAARIWRHAGRVGVSYRGRYPEQSLFQAPEPAQGHCSSRTRLFPRDCRPALLNPCMGFHTQLTPQQLTSWKNLSHIIEARTESACGAS